VHGGFVGALFAVATTLTACVSDPPSATQETVVVSIGDQIANGTLDDRQIPTELRVHDAPALPYLNGGWHPPREETHPTGTTFRSVWTRGAAAVVEVQLATVSELSVKIAGGLVSEFERLPTEVVTVLWNDEAIETLIADKQSWPLHFTVPAETQQLGLNRMVLLPHHWTDTSPAARQRKETDRALRIDSIRFSGNPYSTLDHSPPGIPDGSNFTQRPGSVLTYYSVLPEAARLVGSFETISTDVRGQLVLSLDKEPAVVIFDSNGPPLTAPNSEQKTRSRDFDLDLSEHSGRPAGLSFVVDGDQRAQAGKWVEPVLIGQKDVPAELDREETSREHPPNFLVVLFDTLRADATEPYGAPAGRSPAIARLAREGTLFQNSFSTAASTRVSVASLLTGVYPPRHRTIHLRDKLPAEIAYLPEILATEGYRTVGVVNNPQVSSKWGFSRGFAAFEEFYRHDEEQVRADYPAPHERAQWTFANFVEPAIANRGGNPFFVYLHELDPHFPYEPLPPYDSTTDDGYRGSPLAKPGIVPKDQYFSQVVRQLLAVNEQNSWMDTASLHGLRQRYAGEVAYMDAYLGWILDFLDDTGLRNDTVVVFVSDHGEEFLEHGRWGHGRQLYDPAVRVPLIISLDGKREAGKIVEAPVELVDLAPTLLRMAGAPIPAPIQGYDLFERSRLGAAADSLRPSFAYGDWTYASETNGGRPAHRQTSIRIGEYKLIRTRYLALGETLDTYELYNLESDAGETINLWFSRPILGHVLRQRLDAQSLTAARPLSSTPQKAQAEIARLKAELRRAEAKRTGRHQADLR
jgi:arylsulfatase A-like enzyme